MGIALRVKILSLTGDTVGFLLSESDVAFANALRRTMVAEVPCMTIDDIFIFDNSSLLPDETLAHRVGLIPLTTDLDSYVLPERCNCNSDLGCSLCRVVLTLDVEADEERRVVYSRDIASEDPIVIPATPNIPVVKLAPGQAIRFEAYARLGLGKMHAKWQPVSMCTYQHLADIEIDEASCTLCRKCVDACPRGVLEMDENELKVADLLSCILCGACVDACPVEPPAIKQNRENDTFLFTVESAGGLPPERIVSEAANILTEKLNEFSGKVRRGETDEDIEEFEAAEEFGRGLYSVGAGDYEDEEGEGEQE
jgi:DNA-directed RNA polymerase subunit D